jgi:hypothetical protein
MFSDEWLLRQSVTQSKLLSIIGKTEMKIGARQCSIATVSHRVAQEFYDAHHIQGGNVNCTVHLALMNNGIPVAMMSFKRTRSTDELVRFASSMSVVGGASKLLNHYMKQYSPRVIISFADMRWSQGDLYYRLGFTKVAEVPPMQSYVENYTVRHHKLKFKSGRMNGRKPGETEWEHMRRLGYDRIWDCGKLKFELILDSGAKVEVESRNER